MATIAPLLPWLGVAAVGGLVNVANAWATLIHDCRSLVYFRPFRTPGVYVWAVVQFTVPALATWVALGLNARPVVDLALLGKAATAGLLFVAGTNASTEIAGKPLSVRPLYDWGVRVAYVLIAARETERTTLFWSQFRTEMLAGGNVGRGLDYLRERLENDIAVSMSERQQRLAAIDRVAAEPDRQKEVRELRGIIDVRRRELPTALQHFGCSDALIASLTR